jgi:hypothetical protein
MKFASITSILTMVATATMAQYAPQAGVAGSTAIDKNSPSIKAWATGCTVTRGFMDIADPANGVASAGSDGAGTGAADNSIVSLGDSGVAVLTFASPIRNESGPDFAIFENGFANPQDPEMAFLELAFVEVSSNGLNYFRFPASCEADTTVQIGNTDYSNARQFNNLAGKYKSNFGTPFDLEELKGLPQLDVNNITHVRIVDAVGSMNSAHAQRDKDGRKINDPYPTPFASSGFDLDAVGVMHTDVASGLPAFALPAGMQLYPNPAVSAVRFKTSTAARVEIYDVTGRNLLSQQVEAGEQTISVAGWTAGVYTVRITVEGQVYACKLQKI